MASETANRLRDQRERTWEQAKELADRAAEANRNMDGEEERQWIAYCSELDALDQRIKAVLEGEQRAKDTEDAFAKLEGRATSGAPTGSRTTSQPTDNGGAGGGGTDQGAELRKFLSGKSGSREFVLNATKSSDRRWNPAERRSLTIGSLTAGGDLVPTSFYDRLVEHMIQVSAILQAGPTVLNTASGETIQVPKTTSHPTGALVSEGGNIATGSADPVFGQVSLGAYKYGDLVQVSRELIDDSGVDLEGYLARRIGEALGNAIGTDLVLGTGTGAPHGIVPNATLGVTSATAVVGVPSSDDLISLKYSVIPPYRNSPSCVYMMNDTTLSVVRKLKDGVGRYIWEPNYQVGNPDTLLGKPIVVDYNVASTGLNAKSILFGDFSKYFVRFAGGLRFERSDEFAFGSDLVTFRALMRADGNLVDVTGAVKYFKGAAS